MSFNTNPTSTDPDPAPGGYMAPPGVSIHANMAEAKSHADRSSRNSTVESYRWFYEKVKNNKDGSVPDSWDYKQGREGGGKLVYTTDPETGKQVFKAEFAAQAKALGLVMSMATSSTTKCPTSSPTTQPAALRQWGQRASTGHAVECKLWQSHGFAGC